MKKLFFALLCVAVFATLAMAQNPTYATGSTGGIHGVDVLGAHQNNGRGCAGCHAPHSGGQGGGGNAAANANAFADPSSGDNALFGQDLTPLYNTTFYFGDNGDYQETLPPNSDTTTQTAELRQIAMCLACHDGNIAKGGMMVGTSYEQRMGLLPANLYGTRPIPTLLGNDGSTPGNYKNDHPVGVMANLGAVGLSSYLTVTWNGTLLNTITATGAYVNFVSNYGSPAVQGSKWSYGVAQVNNDTTPGDLFLTCTTCHNQHSMYIYKGATSQLGVPTAMAAASYPTYFFINGPYNPGSLVGDVTGTRAASTTQFCRSCHFSESNEALGVNNVSTAF